MRAERRFGQRSWQAGRALGAVLLVGAVSGCGEIDGEDPGIEAVQSALVNYNEFSPNSPTAVETNSALNLVFRTGNGSDPNKIPVYELPSSGHWKVLSPTYTASSAHRPTQWFEQSVIAWSTVWRDTSDKVKDSSTLSKMNNVFNAPSGLPEGPPMVLRRSNGSEAAYSRWSNGKLRESYLKSGQWGDFEVVTPADQVPSTAPYPIVRSVSAADYHNVDSVYYGCTGQAGLRICESRLDITIGGSSGTRYNFSTLISSTGSFADGTRPTAIAKYKSGGSPWLFFVLQQTDGTRYLQGWHETSPLPNTTAPTFAPYTIESSTTAIYSTPMPYIRSDGKEAIVYFRTDSGSSTRLYEASWGGSSWTRNEITDIASTVPNTAASEPWPMSFGGTGGPTDIVFYRLPSGTTGHKDTILLRRESLNYWSKQAIPTPTDESNLYGIKPGIGSLYKITKAAAQPTTLSVDFANAVAFTTDRLGLGYAMKDDILYEVNLQDGKWRKPNFGGKTWPGTKSMTYGYDSVNTQPKSPRLWVIQSGTLYKVNLGGGLPTAVLTVGSTAAAIAYATDQNIYMLQGSDLFRVNQNTGAKTPLGSTWSGWKAMTSAGGQLFILKGTDIYKYDIATSTPTKIVSGVSGTNFSMAVVQGYLYFTNADNSLKKLQLSNSALTTVNTGTFWNVPVLLAPREWTL